MTRRLRRAGVIGLLMALTLAAAPAFCDTGGGEIPIGPADENAETSRSVMEILGRCAEVYRGIDTIHASGFYLSASKSADSGTSYTEANVTLDMPSADRIAVHCRSKDVAIDCSFVANGSTVTMVWADYSHNELRPRYLKMRQPDSLAAFVDMHRKGGEIYSDRSGALGMAAMSQLLLTENTEAVVFDGITRYVYEGEEEVNGNRCHRIRFIQSEPDVNVILWIGAEDFLEHKNAFIYSYNEDYELVDSFEEGTEARMMVITWDEITTDSAKIDMSAFDWEIPEGYKRFRRKRPDPPEREKPGLWESLVDSAAASVSDETTWSVTRRSGNLSLSVNPYIEVPREMVALTSCQLPGEAGESIALATRQGLLNFYNSAGEVQRSLDMKQDTTGFDILEDTSGTAIQVIAPTPNGARLKAWDLDGKQLWQYGHRFGEVRGYAAGVSEPSVYLAFSGGNGLRRIGSEGQIEFAYGRSRHWGNKITPAPPGINRVMFGLVSILNTFEKDLTNSKQMFPGQFVQTAIWDVENQDAPLLTLTSTTDDDVVLQRRTDSGNTIWTTMLQTVEEESDVYGLGWMRVNVDGEPQRVLFCALGSGLVAAISPEGKVLYRGMFTADAATVKRNGGHPIAAVTIADLDGNGTDEAYIKVDKNLLELRF